MNRPSWPAYFMSLARVAATRSTCDRKHVGAVLVLGNRVIATGYNGSAPGAPHCDDVGHDMLGQACGSCGVLRDLSTKGCPYTAGGDHGWTGGNCVRTIHAEQNAIFQAARHGVAVAGAIVYVNTYPCWPCYRGLVAAGVSRIYYEDAYRNDPRVDSHVGHVGVEVTRLSLPGSV